MTMKALSNKVSSMLRNLNKNYVVQSRSFKNFGHKRQYEPLVTTIWHGFLTFTFIGMAVEWDRCKMLLFGDDIERELQESIESKDKI